MCRRIFAAGRAAGGAGPRDRPGADRRADRTAGHPPGRRPGGDGLVDPAAGAQASALEGADVTLRLLAGRGRAACRFLAGATPHPGGRGTKKKTGRPRYCSGRRARSGEAEGGRCTSSSCCRSRCARASSTSRRAGKRGAGLGTDGRRRNWSAWTPCGRMGAARRGAGAPDDEADDCRPGWIRLREAPVARRSGRAGLKIEIATTWRLERR